MNMSVSRSNRPEGRVQTAPPPVLGRGDRAHQKPRRVDPGNAGATSGVGLGSGRTTVWEFECSRATGGRSAGHRPATDPVLQATWERCSAAVSPVELVQTASEIDARQKTISR